MKKLVIIGAGGCGREVLQIAVDVNRSLHKWDSFAFLDYDKSILKGKNCCADIEGDDDTYVISEEDEFVCAIGDGNLRKKLIEKYERKGAKFINLIHPTAIISDSAVLEKCIIVYPYVVVTSDVFIGKGTILNMKCVVGHDSNIGEYATISPGCNICGRCRIGNNVFMGCGANIIPNITIGDNAFICAGSVVMTKVKSEAKMIGNPAKRVKDW